jgi:translocon-associated protein subunit beta
VSRDVTVSFRVYNVGTSAAVDVELTEAGFKNSDLFTAHVGSTTATWKNIAAGTNVTHTFVVKPKRATEKSEPFYGYPAVATYAASAEGARFNAYSNDVGAFHIYQRGELAKKSKSSLSSWLMILVSVLITTGAPLVVYRYMQANFPNGLPKKR